MNEETKALISLLDDPDGTIFDVVSHQLISKGSVILPILEDALPMAKSDIQAGRIEFIQQRVHFQNIYNLLKDWNSLGSHDLLEGLLIISKYHFPLLTLEELENPIRNICKDIWLEMHENLNALEQIAVFNNVFYEVYGFSGVSRTKPSVFDALLNVVLSRKRGSALLLAILYYLVASKLGLPVKVFLFSDNVLLLGYMDPKKTDTPKVLFYIHPFSKGIVFGKSELDKVLMNKEIIPNASFSQPCSNQDIIRRLLENISLSYKAAGMQIKYQDTKKFYRLFQK